MMIARTGFLADDPSTSGIPLLSTTTTSSIRSHDSLHSPWKRSLKEAVSMTLIPAVFWICCATVISFPGMMQQLSHDLSPKSFFRVTAGATAQNIWLLSLGSFLGVKLFSTSTLTCQRGLSALALFILFSISVFLALGDYSFRDKTNGTPPTLWIIAVGLRHAKEEIASQFEANRKSSLRIVATVMGAYCKGIFLFVLGGRLYKVSSLKLAISRNSLALKTITVLFLYAQGAWMPVTNGILCCLGSLIMPPPGGRIISLSSGINYNDIQTRQDAPNVILLVQESIAADVLYSKEGKQRTPFYHGEMQTMENMYHFPHARTVAGTTHVGLSAILTGKVPYNEQGAEDLWNTTIATDFKKQGYETAMVTSYQTDWTGTGWAMLTKLLKFDFDTILEPKTLGEKAVNEVGMDDRTLLDHFDKWLLDRSSSNSNTTSQQKQKRPFFAPMLFFNTHVPFLAPENVTDYTERYLHSFETMDQSLQKLLTILEQRGELQNTIIIGASDHGETTHEDGIIRFNKASSHVLHVPLYMHIPRKFLSDQEHTLLQHNKDQLVSNLDLFPTIRHILDKHSNNQTKEEDTARLLNSTDSIHPNGYLQGQNLLGTKIADDRMTLGWQGEPIETCGQFGTYHTKNGTYVIRWSGSYYTGDWTGNDRLIKYPEGAHTLGDMGKLHEHVAGEVRKQWFQQIKSLRNIDMYLSATKQKLKGPGRLCWKNIC